MRRMPEPLRLHRSIYPARAIADTVKAFSELVEATVARQGEYNVVTLRPLVGDHSPDSLRSEFANYALGRAARRR